MAGVQGHFQRGNVEETAVTTVRYMVGDVFDRMAELEDNSVDLILTSPPFLALRSYLPADHPDKSKEIGSESTPAEFVDVLLELSAEWRRLLTPHGSLVVELGDTYSGKSGWGDELGNERYPNGRGVEASRPDASGPGWPLAKSLTLTPEAYRFALAYGINPHTGQPSPAGQWRVRNVIRWVRPNPPVGALGDKFRPATSELVVACVSKDRWFDLDAVREPLQHDYDAESGRLDGDKRHDKTDGGWATLGNWNPSGSAGAPPLDWWKISPKGYAGAHYAVWPSELCVKPIKAMCPREVCRECGEPRRRITEATPEYATNFRTGEGSMYAYEEQEPLARASARSMSTQTAEYLTVGWSDCGHDNYRPGLVLDPFAGTGTTLAVAHGHGRDAIGIDIDERSTELARDRVGPLFLEIDYKTEGAVT
jgi:site-specific DNA-methyltransferase (adenine-specific)